jgi:hypothetical protein
MEIDTNELEQLLFNKQTKMDKDELEKAIIETQQKLYSLIAMMNKSNDTDAFSLDMQVFKDIKKRYPFLSSIYEDQGMIRITCNKMPLEIKASMSHISNDWHEGTIYVSNTGFDFDIFAKPKKDSTSTSLPYSFKNNTRVITKHNDTFYNPYIQDGVRGDLLGVSYMPTSNSSRYMSHPHSDDAYSVFSNVCYGSNPFSELVHRGFSNKTQFYNFIRFVLLWLETGNFQDWYANLITQKFQLQQDLVSDVDERFIIRNYLSETFVTLQELVRFLYTSEALVLYSETELRRELVKFKQRLQDPLDVLIPFVGRSFTNKEGQAARIEVYSPVKALKALIYVLQMVVDGDPVNTIYLTGSRDLERTFNVFYAASVFSAAKASREDLKPFNETPLINLLINDLMPEISDKQYGRDILGFTSVYKSGQLFKTFNAPYVYNLYLKEKGYRLDWADMYLPSTPIFETPNASDYVTEQLNNITE